MVPGGVFICWVVAFHILAGAAVLCTVDSIHRQVAFLLRPADALAGTAEMRVLAPVFPLFHAVLGRQVPFEAAFHILITERCI